MEVSVFPLKVGGGTRFSPLTLEWNHPMIRRDENGTPRRARGQSRECDACFFLGSKKAALRKQNRRTSVLYSPQKTRFRPAEPGGQWAVGQNTWDNFGTERYSFLTQIPLGSLGSKFFCGGKLVKPFQSSSQRLFSLPLLALWLFTTGCGCLSRPHIGLDSTICCVVKQTD